jgi:2-desacetyl-2-hydroxyethyl bacteriochlorophyllide A dehydrogenase
MEENRPMAFVTSPGRVEFQNVPLRIPGDDDVQIKVKVITLCGSDLHIFRGAHPSVRLPIPVGHEIFGEVSRVGQRVSKVVPGDRVTVEPVIACGHCDFCIHGNYHLCENISFQYREGQGGITTDFIAHERWVHKIPDQVSDLAGALVEPLSVAVHAIRRSGLAVGEDVGIFGAGPIGLLVLQVARALGAGRVFITDVREPRLEMAKGLGASLAINSLDVDAVKKILSETSGAGVDFGFEVVGLGITLRQMLASLKKGGTGVMVGLFEQPDVAVQANLIVQREISIKGSQGYHWDFMRAIGLLENGSVDIEKIITHTFEFNDIQKAFDLLENSSSNAIKVAIMPG